MSEVVKILQEKLIINSKEAESLQCTFESTHLDFLYNFKDNLGAKPSGRRYTDEIKRFALKDNGTKFFIAQIESVTFPGNEYNIKTNIIFRVICMLFDC